MKIAILFLVIVYTATTAFSYPQGGGPEIISYESDGDDRSYNFQYETSDGVARVEKGVIKDSGNPDDPTLLSVEGSYTYTDDTGVSHTVSYIADEKGYRILPGST